MWWRCLGPSSTSPRRQWPALHEFSRFQRLDINRRRLGNQRRFESRGTWNRRRKCRFKKIREGLQIGVAGKTALGNNLVRAFTEVQHEDLSGFAKIDECPPMVIRATVFALKAHSRIRRANV